MARDQCSQDRLDGWPQKTGTSLKRLRYFPKSRLIRGTSAGLAVSVPEYWRLTRDGFFRRMWPACPFILSTLPVRVILNRAAAPLCVLSFGNLFNLFNCIWADGRLY